MQMILELRNRRSSGGILPLFHSILALLTVLQLKRPAIFFYSHRGWRSLGLSLSLYSETCLPFQYLTDCTGNANSSPYLTCASAYNSVRYLVSLFQSAYIVCVLVHLFLIADKACLSIFFRMFDCKSFSASFAFQFVRISCLQSWLFLKRGIRRYRPNPSASRFLYCDNGPLRFLRITCIALAGRLLCEYFYGNELTGKSENTLSMSWLLVYREA